MRLSQKLLLSLFVIVAVGCGDKTPSAPPPPPPGGNPGGNPGANNGGNSGGGLPITTPGGTATPSTCVGSYRFQNGTQFQVVTLNAAGTCEIANNQGIVESTASCSFRQNGTLLTLSSQGVSVDWSIASDCSSLSAAPGAIYFRQ